MATLAQLSEWFWLNLDLITTIGTKEVPAGTAYCVWFADRERPIYLTQAEWTVLMDYLAREGMSTFYQQRQQRP